MEFSADLKHIFLIVMRKELSEILVDLNHLSWLSPQDFIEFCHCEHLNRWHSCLYFSSCVKNT